MHQTKETKMRERMFENRLSKGENMKEYDHNKEILQELWNSIKKNIYSCYSFQVKLGNAKSIGILFEEMIAEVPKNIKDTKI